METTQHQLNKTMELVVNLSLKLAILASSCNAVQTLRFYPRSEMYQNRSMLSVAQEPEVPKQPHILATQHGSPVYQNKIKESSADWLLRQEVRRK